MSSRGGAVSDGPAAIGLSGARDGPGRRHMQQIQRARILVATAQAAYEFGARYLTVANVLERAGVSRRTFYELFDDCEDCLLAAIEDSMERAGRRMRGAYETAPGAWRGRTRASLTALLGFFDEHPCAAHLLIVEWP
ncbi:MAG TPA: TetR/AcrR family transcriptional regulator, partial [Solirubrobacteraceae bacterium]|nr:TetR/AcrR family transcriptional regulator [Solirubrobacteraceae bacterium]